MNEEMQIIQNPIPSPVNAFADEGFEISVDMTTAKTSFCSMDAKTDEEKGKLFNATNNPDARLSDCINQKIYVKDLYIEVVNCTNEETGEITPAPRIVIIDKDNKSYQCVSVGIYSALKKMIQIYGVPTWSTPIPIMVKQITKGARKMLTLNIAAQ
jgi:hypothetical protein